MACGDKVGASAQIAERIDKPSDSLERDLPHPISEYVI